MHIEHSIHTAPTAPTPHIMQVAAMFGIGVDHHHTLPLVAPIDVPLPIGGIVFITGPSGSGKSTILRLIEERFTSEGTESTEENKQKEAEPDRQSITSPTSLSSVYALVKLSDLPNPPAEISIVDALPTETLDAALHLLSRVGLGEAFVMLRSFEQLSDGQRARFRMAQAMNAASRSKRAVIVADEFAATLDRVTAANVARNIRRWITDTPHTLIAATTHDDLLEPLSPDVLVHQPLDGRTEVSIRGQKSEISGRMH